jgi:hypothetical protein
MGDNGHKGGPYGESGSSGEAVLVANQRGWHYILHLGPCAHAPMHCCVLHLDPCAHTRACPYTAFCTVIQATLTVLAAAAAAMACAGAGAGDGSEGDVDMVAADAVVAALETDEGVVGAVGEGGADAVANGDDGGAMPTMELETAQAPERALERPVNNKKGRVIGGKRRSLPRSRYTLCLLTGSTAAGAERDGVDRPGEFDEETRQTETNGWGCRCKRRYCPGATR